jgi:LPS-assembly lipoprotein
MKFKLYRILIVCIFSVMLSACGFELRGYEQPPTVFSFISIYISDPDSYSITREVKRTILSGKSTRVVDDARGAEAILEVLKQTNEKSILSLSGEGRVREFLLRYLVTYRLVDGRGVDLVPAKEIVRERVLPFTDEQVVAKEAEEAMLVKEMQTEIVRQILRQLATVRVEGKP